MSTDFYFVESPSAHTIPDVTAGWLPEGYTLEDHDKSETSCWYLYQGPENQSIKIRYTLSEGTVLSADTEDAETDNIQINGNLAMLIKKGMSNKLFGIRWIE